MSVPDPENLRALFHASGEGVRGKASHVMGEVTVTSCKVSEIVNPALVRSDLALALGTCRLPYFRVLCRYYITVTMMLDHHREMHASIKDALTLSVTFMFTRSSGGTVAVSPSCAARVPCVAVCA